MTRTWSRDIMCIDTDTLNPAAIKLHATDARRAYNKATLTRIDNPVILVNIRKNLAGPFAIASDVHQLLAAVFLLPIVNFAAQLQDTPQPKRSALQTNEKADSHMVGVQCNHAAAAKVASALPHLLNALVLAVLQGA